MKLWLWSMITAAAITIGRLWAVGYYHSTGDKIVPESLIVAGFWLQFLFFGLGFGMRQLNEQRARRDRSNDR